MRPYLLMSLLALAIPAAAQASDKGVVRMYVHHEVADYATWRKTYDAFASVQKKNGVIAQSVWQSVDNPNEVTVTHDFKTVEKAKAWMALPELKTAMDKGGVKGQPHVWITRPGAK
jgi:heme-degrading monooxygenase HmoA